jgi:AcrR family transcriptional regulator
MSHTQNRVAGADRKRQIVAVAGGLFAKKGYRGTTTREIADRAAVNEAILFRHFAHKEDLYWAVIESQCERHIAQQELRELLAGAPPQEALAVLAEGVLRTNLENPAAMRLYLYAALENHKLSHRLFRTYALGYYEILAEYIRKQIRRGAFRKVDPQLAARSFIGMVAQHYQNQELFGGKKYQRFDLRKVSKTLADIWLAGLERHNGISGRKNNGHRR